MDLGKGFDPKRYGDYSHAEIVYIIKLSAMLCAVEDIQAKFREFSNNTKNISGEAVMEIQADHGKRIQREAEMYLKYIEGSPFFHPRLVLDMYMEVYRDSRILRPTQTFRLGPDEWRTEEEPDNKVSLNALDSATKYLREGEKLNLEKLKRNQALIPSEPVERTETEPSEISWKME